MYRIWLVHSIIPATILFLFTIYYVELLSWTNRNVYSPSNESLPLVNYRWHNSLLAYTQSRSTLKEAVGKTKVLSVIGFTARCVLSRLPVSEEYKKIIIFAYHYQSWVKCVRVNLLFAGIKLLVHNI